MHIATGSYFETILYCINTLLLTIACTQYDSYPSNLKLARITQYWHNPKASVIVFLTMYSSGKPPSFLPFFHRKKSRVGFSAHTTPPSTARWKSRLQGSYAAAPAFPSKVHSSSKARKLSWHVTCTRIWRSSIQVIRQQITSCFSWHTLTERAFTKFQPFKN